MIYLLVSARTAFILALAEQAQGSCGGAVFTAFLDQDNREIVLR